MMGGHKLKTLIRRLKDKATQTKATLISTPETLAILRSTSNSAHPPTPTQISTLLSFGHSSRHSATTLIHTLSTRLLSSISPIITLKTLISLHHLLSYGSFILHDVILSSLLPSSSGHRNPLIPSPSSFKPISSFIRWYSKLIEHLLISHPLLHAPTYHYDKITSLLNADLILEMDCLVTLLEEITRLPDTVMFSEGDGIVAEVVRLVEEDRINVENEIRVRVREVGERVGVFGFGESVELVCLMRRLEECGGVKGGLWREVKEVKERVGEVVVKEERGRRVRRERGFDSARITDSGLAGGVRFGSARLG